MHSAPLILWIRKYSTPNFDRCTNRKCTLDFVWLKIEISPTRWATPFHNHRLGAQGDLFFLFPSPPLAASWAEECWSPWSSGGGRQQRSRERKEAAAPLEVGAADRRLDALIEEEMKAKAARAQSVPVGAAEVKRLGVAAGVGGGHGGQSAATASSGHQGPPEVRQLLNDPRGQVMGLGHLQEAVRQSFEVLQHALQRPSSQPTLLDPLLRPGDQEVMPVPDVEFSQGTGWQLVLPCGRAGWRWSAWGHHPTWLEQDVMIYTLGCWSPILPRRWDPWGR